MNWSMMSPLVSNLVSNHLKNDFHTLEAQSPDYYPAQGSPLRIVSGETFQST